MPYPSLGFNELRAQRILDIATDEGHTDQLGYI
jgi:hypothetical protein